MTVKQIPLVLLGGMFIGLLFLGGVYFLKSVNIIDSIPGLPGGKAHTTFFNKSEVDALKVVSVKNGLRKVWVYFFDNDKFNQPTNFGYTSPAIRETSRSDIATYAMEEIFRGPNSQEMEEGLKTVFGEEEFVALTGNSTCGTQDFVVKLNPGEGVAQVHFCRPMTFIGDASTQILSEIVHKTLTQFEPIEKVQMFDYQEHCFDGTTAATPEDCEF